jgi:hypothetical protein
VGTNVRVKPASASARLKASAGAKRPVLVLAHDRDVDPPREAIPRALQALGILR